jgi:RNA recognition motif-containing protein
LSIGRRRPNQRIRDQEEGRTISARIFVGNLNYDTTKEELGAVLAAAGNIVDLHLPADRETGRPRGFAFVEFSTEAEAAEAVRRFNQLEVRGRKLNVNAADDRPRRTGTAPVRLPRPSFDPMPSGDGGRPPTKWFKSKGSRRGLRGRKRSL